MTLDEAIKHAQEVGRSEGCTQCGQDHRQLARWLIELKLRREETCAALHTAIQNLPSNIDEYENRQRT